MREACVCWVVGGGGSADYIGGDRCWRRASRAVGLWLVCMDRRVVYGYVRGREESQVRGVLGIGVDMGCSVGCVSQHIGKWAEGGYLPGLFM